MSFREVLEGYMQDRNDDRDIAFMEEIVREHEQEIESAKNEGSTETEKTWKEKYKKAFFHGEEKTENEPTPQDPNAFSIDDLMDCFK